METSIIALLFAAPISIRLALLLGEHRHHRFSIGEAAAAPIGYDLTAAAELRQISVAMNAEAVAAEKLALLKPQA